MPHEALTPNVRTLLTRLAIGESPLWHAGRLWFCKWGTQQVVAMDEHVHSEVISRVLTDMPASIDDWLPDGRRRLVAGREARVLHQESDGSLSTHPDLHSLAGICNEIMVDGCGNSYVNGSGFDPTARNPLGRAPTAGRPGCVASAPNRVGAGGVFMVGRVALCSTIGVP
jgi:sugar lactone lactonase YvrE